MPGPARSAGAWLAGLVLAGCAVVPPADPAWTSGRLSVRVAASPDRPAASLDAAFDLRGDGRQGELRLDTPWGARLATTRWSADEALLDTGQGEVRYPDLESLSRAALGEVLPLRALPDWLSGRPWSGAASLPLPAGFEQLGWQVSLAAFADGRIDAVREQAPRVVVRVRLERAAP